MTAFRDRIRAHVTTEPIDGPHNVVEVCSLCQSGAHTNQFHIIVSLQVREAIEHLLIADADAPAPATPDVIAQVVHNRLFHPRDGILLHQPYPLVLDRTAHLSPADPYAQLTEPEPEPENPA